MSKQIAPVIFTWCGEYDYTKVYKTYDMFTIKDNTYIVLSSGANGWKIAVLAKKGRPYIWTGTKEQFETQFLNTINDWKEQGLENNAIILPDSIINYWIEKGILFKRNNQYYIAESSGFCDSVPGTQIDISDSFDENLIKVQDLNNITENLYDITNEIENTKKIITSSAVYENFKHLFPAPTKSFDENNDRPCTCEALINYCDNNVDNTHININENLVDDTPIEGNVNHIVKQETLASLFKQEVVKTKNAYLEILPFNTTTVTFYKDQLLGQGATLDLVFPILSIKVWSGNYTGSVQRACEIFLNFNHRQIDSTYEFHIDKKSEPFFAQFDFYLQDPNQTSFDKVYENKYIIFSESNIYPSSSYVSIDNKNHIETYSNTIYFQPFTILKNVNIRCNSSDIRYTNLEKIELTYYNPNQFLNKQLPDNIYNYLSEE